MTNPPSTSRRATPLYDRERPGVAERPSGRRRRPAPDWGGDELFDRVPRRRFARGLGEHPRPVTPLVLPPLPPARAGSIERRITASPDRVAAWAFMLGVLLILVALATSI